MDREYLSCILLVWIKIGKKLQLKKNLPAEDTVAWDKIKLKKITNVAFIVVI